MKHLVQCRAIERGEKHSSAAATFEVCKRGMPGGKKSTAINIA